MKENQQEMRFWFVETTKQVLIYFGYNLLLSGTNYYSVAKTVIQLEAFVIQWGLNVIPLLW